MTGFDRARIEAAVAEILAAIGEDPSRPGLASTPSRVADAYAEFFSGVGVDASALLGEPVPLESDHADTVVLRGIAFRSVCEHHLLPFIGVAHVAYLPGESVVGLGRIPRVIDALAARPQLQERLTEQIADAIESGAGARGVLVVLDASHACVTTRGPRQTAATTVTVATRGAYADPVARAELMALIGSGAA
ncbi:GTP cyclohydrolase I [Leifsonia naganoensis]|uniref:GTP cyclohydrolase 1 n=1 Tax=Leifsonia naganoensis TaxID=150025 RepID=A0A853DWV0_9MICO|nr:GTP cyclohydrolase I [Leifsonia naganoensis]NYK10535.1 GTP cyclohydrolase I [Leifsonia naganoensis]